MHSHVTADIEAVGAERIAARVLEDAADAVEVPATRASQRQTAPLALNNSPRKARPPISAPLRDKASAPGFLKLP